MEYDNFLFKLYRSAPADARYQAQVLVPASGDGGRFDLPLTPADLISLREQSAALVGYAAFGPTYRHGLGHVPIDAIVLALTRQLQQSLPAALQAAVRTSLQQALEHGRGLRIGVLVDPTAADLAALPWEMLWDPAWSGGYLARSPRAPLVRLVHTSLPPRDWRPGHGAAMRSNNGNRFTLGLLPTRPPRRVLVALVGALPELQVAGAFAEAAAIQQALAPGTIVDLLAPPTTLAALETALTAQPYEVLHIITHGHVDNSVALAYLLFDRPAILEGDADLEPDPVVGARLLSLLQGQPALALIVFSACRSAAAVTPASARHLPAHVTPTPGGFLTNSLGAQIAAGTGVPVVAMQFDILAPAEVAGGDPTRSWARAFYAELARGQGAEWALTAARRALALDNDPVLWAAPTFFVPLYWIVPSLPLHAQVDRRIYQALAAVMEADGQPLQESLLLVGLLLVAGFVMADLLQLPADGGDAVGMVRAAGSLFLTTAVLPALISGCAMVLAARRQPPLRALRGSRALAVLRMSYAGAGLGMLGVLGTVGLLALVAHYLGLAHPLLGRLLAGVLQVVALGGGVLQGLVFAGRYVRVAQSVADAPQIYDLGLLVGLSPLLLGTALAITLPIWYPWLLAGPSILVLVGAALIGSALWVLRLGVRPADSDGR